MKRFVQYSLAVALTLMSSTSYASYCRFFLNGVDLGAWNSTSGDPFQTNEAPLNGNVCGVTARADTSGTCFLKVTNSDDVASGDCLTLGKGVELTTNGTAAISCTGALCGKAVNMNSTGSSGANTTADGLIVTGCFTYGVYNTSKVSNSTIDISGTCTATTRYAVAWGDVDRSTLIGTTAAGTTYGYYGTSQTLSHTIVKNCTYGSFSYSGSVFNNVLMHDNTYTFNGYTGSHGTLKGSVLYNGCHCRASNVCQADVAACVDFAGDPSIVDDEVRE